MDERAIQIVKDYILDCLDKSGPIPTFTIFITWKSKVLQNWKYMLASSLPDGMYFELTYNGDKQEWYLDVYGKYENIRIPDRK